MDPGLSTRYRSHELNQLVRQLDAQASESRVGKVKRIKEERRTHHSCAQMSQNEIERRKAFNNKTREGNFFEPAPPQIPYLFIPKYKNDTFIMPDRVFATGQAGKRMHIKMKDSSICSFQDSEPAQVRRLLRKEDKQRVISGRKMQELNRILDENDGCEKAKRNRMHLKRRRIFQPTSTTSDVFSMVDPMLEPRQPENFTLKKTMLAKTFGPNEWRPTTRGESSWRRGENSWGRRTEFSMMAKTVGMQSVSSQR